MSASGLPGHPPVLTIVIDRRSAYTDPRTGCSGLSETRPSPMRPLRALIAIVCLALGVVLGVLNAEPATVDLGAFEVRAGLGVILLCTLLAGVLLGGLAIVASVVLPLRRELRRGRAPATMVESGTGSVASSLPIIPASSEP